MATKTHEQFLKDMKEKGNSNVEIIGEYVNNHTKIKCKCKINPKHVWEAIPTGLLSGRGCPFCKGLKVNETNDIYHNNYDLVKFFVNEEDTKLMTIGSCKKVKLKCPDCGYEKISTPYLLSHYGFVCPICSDGLSFPNKFIRNMFNMLKIEYIPEWFDYWCKEYRYDLMFEFNNKKYLIEMDGPQHSISKAWGNTPEEIKRIDDIKDKLAQENGYIMIRIDCKELNVDFIFNNIKNSLLGVLFDLSTFDYIECGILSQKSLLIEVCKYHNENPKLSYKKLGKIFKISNTCVKKYISKGIELGLCKEDEFHKKPPNRKVFVYKDNKLIKVYSTIRTFSKYLEKDLGFKMNLSAIYKRLEGKNNFSKNGYDFITDVDI